MPLARAAAEVGLSLKLVAFLQAGLLAFDPVGGLVDDRVKLINVVLKVVAGVAFLASG